jgi:hypothetical protein
MFAALSTKAANKLPISKQYQVFENYPQVGSSVEASPAFSTDENRASHSFSRSDRLQTCQVAEKPASCTSRFSLPSDATSRQVSASANTGDLDLVMACTHLTPSPGTTAAANKWLVKIVDVTKKWTYTATENYTSDLSSAEWIEEAAENVLILGSSTILADYQEVEFNFFDQVAIGNGPLQPVALQQNDQMWLNQNGINGVYSVPSNPSGDAKGFFVTYTSGAPNQAFPPGPWIQTLSPLPPALVNQPYSQTLLVNEATNPVWTLVSGALPVGYTLNASTGMISGIPTEVNQKPFSFSVSATDNTNGSSTGNVGFSLAVNSAPMGNLDISCLGISPPLPTAMLNFAIDGGTLQQCSSVVISIPAGVHTVTSTVTPPGVLYKYTYAGACGPSGQVTVNQGDALQCSISADTLTSFENKCPQGQHCCQPGANGCTQCLPTKQACP